MTKEELNALWAQPHIRSVDFHAGKAGLMDPERIRAMESALNDTFVSLGGSSLSPPVDGVSAEVGYTPQRTVEIFSAKIALLYPGADVLVRDNIATVLLERGWTASAGFPYTLPLTLS